MSETQTTTAERMQALIDELLDRSPSPPGVYTLTASVIAAEIDGLTRERDEAREEARQLLARCNTLTEWGNLLESAAAAHAQTGSAWRVAARQLCDALGIDIGDTNDPYAGLQGAIEAVKALQAEARAEVTRRMSDIDAARNTIVELESDRNGANAFLDEVAFILKVPPAYMGGVNGWAEVKMCELAESRAEVERLRPAAEAWEARQAWYARGLDDENLRRLFVAMTDADSRAIAAKEAQP